MPYLNSKEFEDHKWHRRAERLNAPRTAYVCEKCGKVGIPKAQLGYDTSGSMIHEDGPWHLPDGRVNPDVCRGKVEWKEVQGKLF